MNENKQGEGRRQTCLYAHSVKKICQKRRRHFFKLSFIYVHVYLCKNIAIFYVEFTKKIIVFSLFTPKFFIQKFISILHVKMNRDEQGGAGSKFEVLSELKVFLL